MPADPRILTTTERFVVLPLFLLVGLAVVLVGAHAIRTQRIRKKALYRVLSGESHYTGPKAVRIGIALVVVGVLMMAAIMIMMILGRPLLPG